MITKTLISTSEFQKNFLKNIPENFRWQETPLQVYPLSFIAKYITTPLPLFQSANNYIFHLKEGSIVQLIGTETYTIQAPAVLVILNETVQSLRSISSNVKGHIVLIEDLPMSVMFSHEDLLNLFIVEPVLKLSEKESSWIHRINQLLYSEVNKKNPNRKIAESLLQALLYHILELSEKKKPLSRHHKIAITFKQLVYKHYKNEKKIPFYTDQLHISENYLNRCVKSVFKKTSKEIVTEVTMIQAQLLLWDWSKDIAEIAFELNMDDTSYFSRVFKKVTGKTPTEYRSGIMHDLS